MQRTRPDDRLGAAASFVRQGAVFADIGTDHAHLPIFLLKSGRISRAVAADVNQGPLDRAKANAMSEGVASRIDFRLADGLSGMDDLALTDIAICGMGGELIASIIDRAAFLRDARIRLILQPMTRTSVLRTYLAREGFRIEEEKIISAASRVYVCMAVSYTGEAYSLSEAEAECGKELLCRVPNALERRYVTERLSAAKKKLKGRQSGGAHDSETESLAALVAFYEDYLEVKKP